MNTLLKNLFKNAEIRFADHYEIHDAGDNGTPYFKVKTLAEARGKFKVKTLAEAMGKFKS